MDKITFEKATSTYKEIIFSWLAEPHVQEFWDNSQEHKDDILNFIHGHQQTYFAGTTQYWIGFIDRNPHAFILSDILKKDQTDLSKTHLANMSATAHTISLDLTYHAMYIQIKHYFWFYKRSGFGVQCVMAKILVILF